MPHQPRLGVAGSLVLETIGCATGIGAGAADGAGASGDTIGAGSRMVERRRGAGCSGGGSLTGALGAGEGATSAWTGVGCSNGGAMTEASSSLSTGCGAPSLVSWTPCSNETVRSGSPASWPLPG